jgi:hypothetical protein
MRKTAIASLSERLAGWTDLDGAAYEVGACLGLWPEFGAPYNEDPWHGVKGIMWFSTGDHFYRFLDGLVEMGWLERREEPDIAYRWNASSVYDWGDE